jgi:hypothetical protein
LLTPIIDWKINEQLSFKGGGCEPEQHYALWKRLHRHLDKHNVLQESFMKLMDGKKSIRLKNRFDSSILIFSMY